MPFIPPGYARVLIRYTSGVGHQCQNVIDYAVATPPDQSEVDALSTLYSTPYKAQLNGSGRFNGVRVLIGSDGDPSVLESSSGAGAGARGSALAAPMCQGLIKKVTALSGRHNRGRIFIPDMTEGDVGDNGTLDSTAVTRLNNIASVLYISGVLWTDPVILHEDGGTPTVVTQIVAESIAATLRRRYDLR